MLFKNRPGQVIVLDEIPQFEDCTITVKVLLPDQRVVLDKMVQKIFLDDNKEDKEPDPLDVEDERWDEWAREVLMAGLQSIKGLSDIAEGAEGKELVDEVMYLLPTGARVLARSILDAHKLTAKEVLS